MLKNLFLTRRVFIIIGAIALLFAISYRFSELFIVAQAILGLFVIAILIDLVLLYQPSVKFTVNRLLPKVFSLSDSNKVHIELENQSSRSFFYTIIDETPYSISKKRFLHRRFC